jgi:hypothetical protein
MRNEERERNLNGDRTSCQLSLTPTKETNKCQPKNSIETMDKSGPSKFPHLDTEVNGIVKGKD